MYTYTNTQKVSQILLEYIFSLLIFFSFGMVNQLYFIQTEKLFFKPNYSV